MSKRKIWIISICMQCNQIIFYEKLTSTLSSIQINKKLADYISLIYYDKEKPNDMFIFCQYNEINTDKNIKFFIKISWWSYFSLLCIEKKLMDLLLCICSTIQHCLYLIVDNTPFHTHCDVTPFMWIQICPEHAIYTNMWIVHML